MPIVNVCVANRTGELQKVMDCVRAVLEANNRNIAFVSANSIENAGILKFLCRKPQHAELLLDSLHVLTGVTIARRPPSEAAVLLNKPSTLHLLVEEVTSMKVNIEAVYVVHAADTLVAVIEFSSRSVSVRQLHRELARHGFVLWSEAE